MASCLVPDFPAVMMALQHLGELDRQLKEEKVPFHPEASHHLKEIAAAVTKLETSRRSVHEQLEVETIENGKVRHQVHKVQDRISKDITADVAAARESNAKEMEELHAALDSVADLHRAAADRQQELLRQHALLLPERERVRATHEADTASLNHQVCLKHSAQARLQRTLGGVEELKGCIAVLEEGKASLERDVAREGEAFHAAKSGLVGELERVAQGARRQREENAREQDRLSRSNDRRLDADDRLGELTRQVAQLESAAERLAASRGRHEEQLREAAAAHQEVRRQTESAEEELGELRHGYAAAGQRLQEDLVLLDHQLEEGRAVGAVRRETLATATEAAKAQRREESEARAVHLNVSERLERSTRRLEERLASIAQQRAEAQGMEEETGRLLEKHLLDAGHFQESQEKLRGRLATEKWHLGEAEVEKWQQGQLLQGAKTAQEADVAKATADIWAARARHGELCLEEVALRRGLASSDDVDALTGQLTRAELDFVRAESEHCQERERLAAETEDLQRESAAKEKELEEREAALSEAEARHRREEASFQGLERHIAGLETEKARLERSAEELREETAALLGPREEAKAGLEAERALHRGLLVSQAAELMAVEVRIRGDGRRLEAVSQENSRMRLSALRMTEDIASARGDAERHGRGAAERREQEEAVFGRVLRAWEEDLAVTREGCDGDRPLVAAFGALVGRLGSRSARVERVAERVRQQLQHISKLGY